MDRQRVVGGHGSCWGGNPGRIQAEDRSHTGGDEDEGAGLARVHSLTLSNAGS